MSKYPFGWEIRSLGSLLIEKKERLGNGFAVPFSVSKVLGIVPQREKFKKRVASSDISKYKVIRKGDFAYDPMLLWDGSINRMNRNEIGAVSPAYVTFQINPNLLDSDYFLYYLKAETTKNFYKSISKGTNVRRQKAEFRDFAMGKFLMPPLPEQKKIAEIISGLQRLIMKVKYQKTKNEYLKKAMINNFIKNGFYKNIQKIGEFPAHWEITNLGNNLSLMTDYVANGSFQSLRENVRVFDSKNFAYYVRLYDLKKGLGHSSQKYLDENSFKFLNKSSLKEGDILIANIGNVGELFIVPSIDYPSSLAPNMILMRCNSRTNPKFLFYYLQSDVGKKFIANAISGSVQPKLNKTELKKVKSIIPPLPEQNLIVNSLLSVENLIENYTVKLNKLEILEESISKDLLSGNKRIKV